MHRAPGRRRHPGRRGPTGRAGVLLAATAVVVVTAACSNRETSLPRPSRAFCEAAYRYENRIQRTPRPTVEKQIEMVRVLVEHAPPDLRRDARVFLDALERVEHDPSIKDDPKIRAAVDRVNRRTSSGCGFFEQDRNSGGGI